MIRGAAILGVLALPACTQCRYLETKNSVEGPSEATAGTESILGSSPVLVTPDQVPMRDTFLVEWLSRFETVITLPQLHYGLEGSLEAAAVGARLCWCREKDSHCKSWSSDEEGVRCVPLQGTLDITRLALEATDLGDERNIDMLLDVVTNATDVRAAMQLHIVLQDDFTHGDCPGPGSIISGLNFGHGNTLASR